jgi:hypothetical protein
LFNRDPHVDAVPESLEAFHDLRDRLYLARRARIIERRAEERAWLEDHVLPAATKAKEAAAGPLYSRAWLQSSGFEGFVPRFESPAVAQRGPDWLRVYAVLRDTAAPPRFLATSKGGRSKDGDPTVPVELLRRRWHDRTPILYFGKADSLRPRIRALVQSGAGEPVGHWGGRYLWQVEGCEAFLLAWREVAKPREVERDLLADFAAHFGGLPFANIVG